MKKIKILGARQNNLKSVDIEIPRNQIVVFTGVSGSGKSSLAFETINAEAQRQLNETLGTYAQSHLPKIPKPDCDLIENISPSIVVKQKKPAGNSRSTVGTITEIYTYLRLLFSRVGMPQIGSSSCFSFNSPEGMCPACNGSGNILALDEKRLIDYSKSLNEGAILFPDFKVGGWQWKYIADGGKFDKDLPICEFSEGDLNKLLYGREENVVLSSDLDLSFCYEGVVVKINRLYVNKNQETLSKRKAKVLTKFLDSKLCSECGGERLSQKALSVKVNGYNIAQVSKFQIDQLIDFVSDISDVNAQTIIDQIQRKARHITEIGVGYLSLSRRISTLSGGELQRIRLASHLGSSLTEMIYILDEPSTGLHPRDVYLLNDLLKTLRNNGNTVLIVEHDPDVIRIADHLIDIGPFAGAKGGEVVFQGEYQAILSSDSLTGKLLRAKPDLKKVSREINEFFHIKNASYNNLKNISTKIPRGLFTCITGVAGSGKSSLIHSAFLKEYPEAVIVDQSVIGQSERSNAATYTGLFDNIRKAFAVQNKVKASLFSFNSEGACSKCNGLGFVEMEMAFLDPVRTCCSECNGRRFKKKILEYKLNGLSIADVLDLTINQAISVFKDKKIAKQMKVLQEVGLGYLTLGQPLASLSGGECQRVKLSKELSKTKGIYVLDEPTTGLHLSDVKKIIEIIESLADKGNTVIVIEHNLDVISQADWVIDLGPEGGIAGGEIIFEGTTQELIKCPNSYTGKHLKNFLQ
jgi:excinuclease UvrABC ATPase subunit